MLPWWTLSDCTLWQTVCLLHLCKRTFLFIDMIPQLECSQRPLVEMYYISFLFIICRYNITTGTFTVPPTGDIFYYFSVYCLQIQQQKQNIHSAPWWGWILFTSQLIFLCGIVNMLFLLSKSMEKCWSGWWSTNSLQSCHLHHRRFKITSNHN